MVAKYQTNYLIRIFIFVDLFENVSEKITGYIYTYTVSYFNVEVL